MISFQACHSLENILKVPKYDGFQVFFFSSWLIFHSSIYLLITSLHILLGFPLAKLSPTRNFRYLKELTSSYYFSIIRP